jgi:hypothetical protein
MNRTKLITSLLATAFAAAILGVSASAQAQDSTTPPPSETAPPPAAHSSSSSGSSISLAGGDGLGIGATVPLTNQIGGAGFFPGANVVYDAGMFHVEGILGFTSQPNPGTDRTSNWVFGVGGWYHFHRGSSSDFSLGGVIAIDYLSAPAGSRTLTALEPGALVRAFVTPNVAVFARTGLAILLGDSAPGGGANFYLGGQPVIVAGFTYFFK